MQNAFNSCNEFYEYFNDDLLNFCKNHCADCSDFGELKDIIRHVKIKNNRCWCKFSKFTLQTYALVHQELMNFSEGRFDYETLTTINETMTMINFFESIHRLINLKIHLHHLHVTGKIYGYPHDFCNMKVRENQNQFSWIVHNFLGFGMFFLVLTFVLYVLSCIHGFFSEVLTCVCASRAYVFYVSLCVYSIMLLFFNHVPLREAKLETDWKTRL